MHESRLLADLVRRVVAVAEEAGARVERVRCAIAADGPLRPEQLQRGFAARAEGTLAAEAEVLVEPAADVPRDAVVLVSVTVVG